MSAANNNINQYQNYDQIIDETKEKLVDNQENINKISQRDFNYENNNNENHNNFKVNDNQNNLNNKNNNNENNYNYNNNQNFNYNDNEENEFSNLNIQKEIESNPNNNKNLQFENSFKENISKSKYDDLFGLEKEQPSFLSFSNKNINRLQLSMKSFQEDKKKLEKLSNTKLIENVSYLEPNEFKYLNDNNIILIENEIQKLENTINRKELSLLVNSINKCSLNNLFDENNKYNNYNIEPIINLKKLIENTFFFDKNLKEQMLVHYIELENIVYKFRGVKGDGNCFYRSIIFIFMENIIMEKNIMLLKEITTDINTKFSEKYINNLQLNKKYINDEKKFKKCLIDNLKNIKKDLIIQCLYVLIISLDNPSLYNFDIYIVLIKLFIYCTPFEQALIYYLKFILFEYILNNIEKYYTKEFSINLINLLPEEYVNNFDEIDKPNEFRVQEYFMEELLKMGTDAERIVIYCTPFVLNCDINIVMYEFDLPNDAINQKLFECFNKKTKLRIEILFRKTHYDVVYNKEYYLKYKHYLDKVSWKLNDINIIQDIDIENMKRIQRGEEVIKEEKNINNVYPIYDQNDNNINNNNNGNYNNNNGNYNNNNGNYNNNSGNYNNNNGNYNNNINKFNINEKPENINSLNLCQFCYNEISPNSKSFPLKLCQKCLLSHLENSIFINYLSYLQNVIISFNKNHYDLENALISYFNKQQIEINKKNYELMNIILYYSETEFEKIINTVKKKSCTICQNNNAGNNIKYNLPCGCVLCSDECINNYFTILLVNEVKILKNYHYYSFIFKNCFCGYQFTINDYFKFKKNFEYLNGYIDIILNHNLTLKCLLCLNTITIKDLRYMLILKDDNYKKFELKEFKHLLCEKCNNKLKQTNKDGIKGYKEIDCQLCNYFGNKNSIHTIIKVKKLKKDEEDDDSGCMIF